MTRLLNMTGETNPQSRLYSETLQAFSETVSLYQRLTSVNSTRRADQFVEQILAIDESDQHLPTWAQMDNSSTLPTSVAPSWDEGMLSGVPLNTESVEFQAQSESINVSPEYHEWGDFTMHFSDNFVIDLRTGLL